MRKFCVFSTMVLIFIVFFGGCAPKEKGESLGAFINRMNKANEEYKLSPEGFILDEKEQTLSRFYRFGENEMLLSFTKNEENLLKEMNLVFPKELSADGYGLDFIKNCIICFIDNEEKCTGLLKESDFENKINEGFLETISAESDGIRLYLDTTELGTVITVYKDI